MAEILSSGQEEMEPGDNTLRLGASDEYEDAMVCDDEGRGLEESRGHLSMVSLNTEPRLTMVQRCNSAPSVLSSLRASLAQEIQARIETEKAYESRLEHERHAREEAERAFEKSTVIVNMLSPFEKFSLVFVGRLMAFARCPRPRCFCCGGPCFWFFFVPLLLWQLWADVAAPPVYDDSEPHEPANDAAALFQRWRPKPSRRPAFKYVERARLGLRDCVEHSQARRFSSASEGGNKPVVMLPGMTSTALEVWQGTGCYDDATRQRVWSSRSSTQTFLLDPECLQRHLMLNLSTWDDPEHVRVRASTGLSAADAFGPLNLWGELIVNLAVLGYDETSLALMGFDWRLDATRLERRDAYFTRLKRVVETLSETNCGRRVALLAHSLGANHALYFFSWVEKRTPGWVDRYVDSLTTIGGAFLGAPKCLPYVVSGEMTDALQMGQTFEWLSEAHGGLSRDALVNLTRSWGSVASLLPKGGDALWGRTRSPDDEGEKDDDDRLVDLLDNDGDDNGGGELLASLGGDDTLDFLRDLAPTYMALVDREYSLGTAAAAAGTNVSRDDPRAWSNPLLAPLPDAPSTKIYCLHGVGKPTPRRISFAPITPFAPGQPNERLYQISRKGGVHTTNGDGTVPLLSLGFMCARGWASTSLNPARMRVLTKEYVHEDLPAREAMSRPLEFVQGLANEKDADHITILGNRELIADVIDIVLGGHTTLVKSHVSSDICALAARVPLDLDLRRDGAADACDIDPSPNDADHHRGVVAPPADDTIEVLPTADLRHRSL
ncbi:hypothetical protein CTAYLR_009868 [Chrysophaeum taylorii]|uniref:Phospholipid:diacylglycerol acyltransferase n=1 Tax=Chrysophaeum taylorii TaxID=2483200 RepID=A0AAD7U7Z0_9STRA|nr:hypothetical protein CTAYLR_009868 [Chrysophaeum taylorii]